MDQNKGSGVSEKGRRGSRRLQPMGKTQGRGACQGRDECGDIGE